MKRNDVMEKINTVTDGNIRQINDSTGARVVLSGEVVSLRPRRGAQLLEMDRDAAKSMVSLVGLPIGIARKLSDKTFSELLSELLQHTGSYSVVVKDNTVKELLPFSNKPMVAPERLLNAVEKIIPGVEYNRVDVLPERVISLEIIGEKQDTVVKGDLVRAGVKTVFSPFGTTSPYVQSYAVRLVCTNGMTANNVLAEFTAGGGGGGEGDDIWQFYRQSIRSAYRSFDKVMAGYRKLANDNVAPADRASMLEHLLRQAAIKGENAEAVRALAMENPPNNAWEMSNLITYAASHLLEAGPRQRAQSVNADFIGEDGHAKTCPLCHHSR